MPVDASDRTLGPRSIWQVLRKLLWEIELLKAIPQAIPVGKPPRDVLHVQDARIYAAINAASTAIALVDWLYHSIGGNPDLHARAYEVLGEVCLKDDKSFLSSLRSMNRGINACHQICNANKHFYLRSPEAQFKILVGDVIMNKPDGTTDVGVALHVLDNGPDRKGRGSIDDILGEVAEWWHHVLDEMRIPGKEQVFPQPSTAKGEGE